MLKKDLKEGKDSEKCVVTSSKPVLQRGPRSSSYKCSFPSCNDNSDNNMVKFHHAPSEPKDTEDEDDKRHSTIKNHCMRKNKRYVTLGRLGFPNLKNPRWCSDHEMDEPLRTITTFCHKSKHHAEPIMIHPCPTNVGPKSEIDPMKSKGVAVDRHNTRFLDTINSGEKIVCGYGLSNMVS